MKLDDRKVKNWLAESLKPFIEIDLLKYDPFGQSETFFAFHGIWDFFKLENLQTLLNLKYEMSLDLQTKMEQIIETFFETVCSITII